MGQQSLQSFLSEAQRDIVGPPCPEFDAAVQTTLGFAADGRTFAGWIRAAYPDAAQRNEDRRPRNPVGSLLRRFCNVHERAIVDHRRELIGSQSFGRRPISAADGPRILDTQHDGTTLFSWCELPESFQVVVPGFGDPVSFSRKQTCNGIGGMMDEIRSALVDDGRRMPLADVARSRGCESAHDFLNRLVDTIGYFNEHREGAFNAEVASVVAALIESDIGISNTEIEVFLKGRIHVMPRAQGGPRDALLMKVVDTLYATYGRLRYQTYRETTAYFSPMGSIGNLGFQNTIAAGVQPRLNVGGILPRDGMSKDKLLTRDGWYWDFKAKSWIQNTKDTRLYRVCGRTRAELDDDNLCPPDLQELIRELWSAVGVCETSASEEAYHAMCEAYEAVKVHPKSVFFRNQDEVLFGEKDVVLYLLKHFTRVGAGLSFVELLVIWGALRAGKDTCINTLWGLMGKFDDAENPGWAAPGPDGYFSPQRFTRGREDHTANTAALADRRLLVLPDIPNTPIDVTKSLLDGSNPVHVRHGHSSAQMSQRGVFNNLWLMHGNQKPRVLGTDLAQVDRISVIHFPGQCGPLDQPGSEIWDPSVGAELRLQEDPQIKADAEAGLFCRELFEHMKHCRGVMVEGRKIEPRPTSVRIAAQEMVRVGTRAISTSVQEWLVHALEPREVFVESWIHEVKPLLLDHLRNEQVEDVPTSPQAWTSLLAGLGWQTAHDGPRATPARFFFTCPDGRRLNRNVCAAVCQRSLGNDARLQKYGLRLAYRERLHALLAARGVEAPSPITEAEIEDAANNGIPERFEQ